ncbi:MAG: LUD domain-containing protein [Methanobacteriaceae archaeon]|nr:LUD domain-containing protein [Methanobacteriaceae archaeon]
MKENELKSMRTVFNGLKDRIDGLSNSPEIKELQERVIDIRQKAINNNQELLTTVQQSFKDNDIDCFLAKDDKEAQKIILDVIANEIKENNYDKNNIKIAKSKSNTLREIGIHELLESQNYKIIETDLGDRILQLKEQDNNPVHPTGPAIHLTVKDIADIVNNAMGTNLPPEPRPIMETVREDVLSLLAESNIGLSGANSIAAKDGSLVLIHNEGNISIIASKKLHIILAGIDKLVNTIEESISIAKLETVYATGKPVTSYMNIISGPSQTADIEKQLLKNMYGSEKVVVILLDNGRSQAMKECLWCIGCGNCIVSCPVYNIIGNEFGYSSYLGGRGVAMSKFLKDNKTSFDSGIYKCTLCGNCTKNCPVATPTNEIIESMRSDLNKNNLYKKQHKKIKDNIQNKGSPY